MNHVASATKDPLLNTTMKELIAEASANIRARGAEAAAVLDALPRNAYAGPNFDGKSCAECQRRFESSSEYVNCTLCENVVCRREGTCNGVHHAKHRVAFLKAQKESKA